jgi:uncharacterized protein YcfJ
LRYREVKAMDRIKVCAAVGALVGVGVNFAATGGVGGALPAAGGAMVGGLAGWVIERARSKNAPTTTDEVPSVTDGQTPLCPRCRTPITDWRPYGRCGHCKEPFSDAVDALFGYGPQAGGKSTKAVENPSGRG